MVRQGSRNTAREHRRHFRYTLLAQVEVRGGDSVLVVPIINVSKGGALLTLNDVEQEWVDIGAELEVFLELTEDQHGIDISLDAKGKIVRESNSPRGFGIEWQGISEESSTQIEKLVEYLAAAG